ncbi:MAG TPA: hypothetical protein VM784_07505 [Actinomycetota bacterium]|jgi:hypothetical protein|nr:hypothetical protein [Actinomycetota bacterium]
MSTKLEGQIRTALRHSLDPIRGDIGATQTVVSAVKRRRIAKWATTGAFTTLMSFASVFAWSQVFNPTPLQPPGLSGSSSTPPRSNSNPAGSSDGGGRMVASGEHEGRHWKLYAYTTDAPADGQGPNGDFCHAFRFGEESPGDDFTCGVGEGSPIFPPEYISPVWVMPRHGPHVFYGRVAPPVASVEIEEAGRTSAQARLYESQTDSESTKFFVAFAQPSDRVVIVAYDAEGNELQRRPMVVGPGD